MLSHSCSHSTVPHQLEMTWWLGSETEQLRRETWVPAMAVPCQDSTCYLDEASMTDLSLEVWGALLQTPGPRRWPPS